MPQPPASIPTPGSEAAASSRSPHLPPRRLRGLAQRVGRWTLDALMPPQCLACGETTCTPEALCPVCWPTVRFIDAPFCEVCGLPLDFESEGVQLCAGCSRAHPPFARGRAALVYNDGSSRLILAYKNSDRTDAVPVFARWMARAGRDLLADADVLVPVPLHWTRLLARRFNQAALLAHAICRQTGVAVLPDALVRQRRTAKMGTLGARARARSVAGVFAVRSGAAARIAGRRVVLIDDVLTTGATASGCARTLLAAGAASVDVLALARAVRDLTTQI